MGYASLKPLRVGWIVQEITQCRLRLGGFPAWDRVAKPWLPRLAQGGQGF
jgi:hypothetical protein